MPGGLDLFPSCQLTMRRSGRGFELLGRREGSALGGQCPELILEAQPGGRQPPGWVQRKEQTQGWL